MAIAAKHAQAQPTSLHSSAWSLSPTKQKPTAADHYSKAEVESFLAMASEAIKSKTACLEQAEAKLALEAQARQEAEQKCATLTQQLEQEREARGRLEEELFSCEQAARELREEISAYFGAEAGAGSGTPAPPASITATRAEAGSDASPMGMIMRQDSKLQADLAAIQRRLFEVARLQEPGNPHMPRAFSNLSPSSKQSVESPAETAVPWAGLEPAKPKRVSLFGGRKAAENGPDQPQAADGKAKASEPDASSAGGAPAPTKGKKSKGKSRK